MRCFPIANQSMFLPRPVPLPASRVGRAGRLLLLGSVSFPVIFVLFRCVPELSISSGIMRFSCGFLLACLAAMSSVSFFFLSAPRLGFPAARAVPARAMLSVMSSVSAICLLAVLRCPLSSSLRLSSVRPSSSRCLAPFVVSGTGSRHGCLLTS